MLLARLDLFFVFLALACAFAVIYTQRLFTLAVLMTAFSFTSSSLFFIFDAVDVAFTEAAVGVGISTILILATTIFTSDLSERKKKQHGRRFYYLECGLMALALVLLIFLLRDAPLFGALDMRFHRIGNSYYVLTTEHDIGIKNVVSAILASYRGYDTMGETVVVFIAYLAVGSIFPIISKQKAEQVALPASATQERHLVLRIISKSMIPVIGLFALYVQFHGNNGPGGGFQAGVILATCCVIYGLLYGFRKATRVFSKRILLTQAVSGGLLYVGVGFFCLLRGYAFLDYHAFDFLMPHNRHGGQHIGIFLVELAVLLTVSSVVALIYLAFIAHTTPFFQRKSSMTI